jgi:hypothetical protein
MYHALMQTLLAAVTGSTLFGIILPAMLHPFMPYMPHVIQHYFYLQHPHMQPVTLPNANPDPMTALAWLIQAMAQPPPPQTANPPTLIPQPPVHNPQPSTQNPMQTPVVAQTTIPTHTPSTFVPPLVNNSAIPSNLPVFSSTHSCPGLPNLSKWSDHGKAEEAAAWIDLVLFHANRIGQPAMDCLHYLLEPPALVWLHSLAAPTGGWSHSAIREAFLCRWGSDARFAQNTAVNTMVRGELVQGAGSVSEYTEKFMTLTRHIPNVPSTLLCAHFINGLIPELQGRCCLDPYGNPWSDLPTLLHHTRAEEYRLQYMTARHNQPPPNPLSPKPQTYRKYFRKAESH